MNILFTKKIDTSLFSKIFGNQHVCVCKETVKMHPKLVHPFNLRNNSLIFSCSTSVRLFFENGFVPNENFMEKNFNKIYALGLDAKNEIRKYGFGTYKVFHKIGELLDFITLKAAEESFIHFCVEGSSLVLNEKSPLQNIRYRQEVLYKKEKLFPIVSEHHDGIAFFSPDEVKSFVHHNFLADKILFALGEDTKKELKNYTATTIFGMNEDHERNYLKFIKKQIDSTT